MDRLTDFLIYPATERRLRIWKGLLVGLLGAAFILLYVVALTFDDWKTDVPKILLPVVVVYMAAVLVVQWDFLEYPRARSNRYVSFFQAQFPRVHIQQKLNVPAYDARERWLSVLRPWRDRRHPNHAYYATSARRRFGCRAVYCLQWLTVRVFLLSLLALAVLACLTWLGDLHLPRFYSLHSPGLTAARVAFPLVLLGLYLYVRAANNPDPDSPTGVWLKWREINDTLKAWWDQNEGHGQ